VNLNLLLGCQLLVEECGGSSADFCKRSDGPFKPVPNKEEESKRPQSVIELGCLYHHRQRERLERIHSLRWTPSAVEKQRKRAKRRTGSAVTHSQPMEKHLHTDLSRAASMDALTSSLSSRNGATSTIGSVSVDDAMLLLSGLLTRDTRHLHMLFA
jgi:hypothetical protein